MPNDFGYWYCRYYEEYLQCASDAVKPACGDDASSWQKNYVNKLHQPALKYIACSGTTNVCFTCMQIVLCVLVFLFFEHSE